MTTLLYTHPLSLQHETGDYHPESVERLKAILAALAAEEFAPLLREEPPPATTQQLLRAHLLEHLDHILETLPAAGEVHHLDPDTVMSQHSAAAAVRSAGAVVAAVDAVMAGRADNAFCAMRPPGHHAERDAAMGFCLFNNVAVGALHARDHHGLSRVAVIDFDAHHGNGTQHILWDEPQTFYISTHQAHAYPNTGLAEETGGAGRMLNVPLAEGTNSDDFRQIYDDVILPKLYDYAPQIILLSAGFDAHAADPLAQLRLKTSDYGWLTGKILDLAAQCCQGRVVSVLEGGYDPESVAVSAAAHVRALMGL